MLKLKTIERHNLDELGAQVIREAILNGLFKPGERLKEIPLAEQLSLSRSTTRAALQRLQLEGLVVQKTAGWEVFSISAEDALELYSLRACLEGMAASLVAGSMDDVKLIAIEDAYRDLVLAAKTDDQARLGAADYNFHVKIVELSGNRRLIHQYGLVQQHVRLYVSAANIARLDVNKIVTDHDLLKDTLIAGDITGAELAARHHCVFSGRMLASYLQTPRP